MKAAAERVKESLKAALGAVRERLRQVNQEMTQIQERIEAVRVRIVELRTRQLQGYAHARLDEVTGLLSPRVQAALRTISSSDEFSASISTLASDCAHKCEDGKVEQHKEEFATDFDKKLLDRIKENKEQLKLTDEEIQELQKKLEEVQAKTPKDTQEMIELEDESTLLDKKLNEKRAEKKTFETKVETLETQLTEADGLVEGLSHSLQDGVHDVSQASPGEERGETPSGQTTKDANDVKWKTTRPPTISLGG